MAVNSAVDVHVGVVAKFAETVAGIEVGLSTVVLCSNPTWVGIHTLVSRIVTIFWNMQ